MTWNERGDAALTHTSGSPFMREPQAAAVFDPGAIASPASPTVVRMPELDGLRAIAILLVLIWHYFSNQVSAEPGTTLAATIAMAKASWSGVDLFFVLSGFLIAGILLDHRGSPNIIRNFYIRRACRILPLYSVTLLAFFLWRHTTAQNNSWLFQGSLPDWSYLTFTQNFFMARTNEFGAHWLDVTWSLALEEQFYLFVPLILVFVPLRIGIGIITVLIVLAPVCRAHIGGIGAYVLPFCRADALLIGVLCAVLVRQKQWAELDARMEKCLFALTAGLITGIPLLIKGGLMEMGGTVIHTYLAILYATLLLSVLRCLGSSFTSPLRWNAARWAGERSFAIYLLHQPVSGILHGSFAGRAPEMTDLNGVILTLASLVVTFILADVSFRVVERPAMDYGRRYSYSKLATR